jgi:thioredoxin-like negative regulator of GroEL
VVLAIVLVGCAAEQSSSPPSGLQSTFQGSVEEFSGPGVLLVATWAEWASVWKLLKPEIEAFQAAAPTDVAFRIVNVDQEPAITRRLGATIVPSVVIVKAGMAVEVLPNFTSAEELPRVVSKWLGS